MARVVRVMAHVECDLPRDSVAHVYLRGAEVLRTDLAQ
jgi:chorismate mutase